MIFDSHAPVFLLCLLLWRSYRHISIIYTGVRVVVQPHESWRGKLFILSRRESEKSLQKGKRAQLHQKSSQKGKGVQLHHKSKTYSVIHSITPRPQSVEPQSQNSNCIRELQLATNTYNDYFLLHFIVFL